MAKSLKELAAERGFIDNTASAQEVQQPTQEVDTSVQPEAQEVQVSGKQAAKPAVDDRTFEVVFTATGKEFVLPEQLEEYRKDNPVGAAEYEEEQTNKRAVQRANEIIKNLPVIQFAMDFMRDPEDALIKWDKKSKFYPEWSRKHFEYLILKVHNEYGENIEQMRDPDTRTPEQQQHILEASSEELEQRINLFFGSNYMQALTQLEPVIGQYPPYKDEQKTGEPGVTDDSIYSLKELTVLYFFAKHREISPYSQSPLTADNIGELKAIFSRMDSYFMERTDGGKEAESEKLYFEFIEYDNRPEPSKIERAEASNALTTIGNRLLAISDPEYQNAFITSTGNVGFFALDENGKKKHLALNINVSFLQMLAKAVLIDYMNGNKSNLGTSLYFPTIARELGYDINHRQVDKGKSADETQEVQESNISRTEARTAFVHGIIKEIDNIWGMIHNDSTEYKIISVLAYNPESEILYFESPYFKHLIGALVKKEESQISEGKKYYLWSCDLLHASAANERNQAAVEMATRLLVGVQQRGLKADSKLPHNKNCRMNDDTTVTWSISCKGLIEDCPQIREKLKTQTTSTKTQTIKRTFKAMYRILRKKSDLFVYYSDLEINEIIPTFKTLYSEIKITHHGKNKDYKRPPLPLKDKATE